MRIHRLIFKSKYSECSDLWYAEINEGTGAFRHIFHARTTPEDAWVDLAMYNFRNDNHRFSEALLNSARGFGDDLYSHWGYVAHFVPEAKKVYRSGLSKFLEKHS